MKRKDFLKAASSTLALPLVLNGLPLNAISKSKVLETLYNYSTETNRVLVIVQLSGGNDGLNTLIPLDQYANLTTARSNILIPEAKVLKLNDATGLHPGMLEIKNLFSDQKIGLIQSVGYPDPNYSHFRSTDIFTSASDANVVENSGWGGRYLQEEYPGFPDNYPNEAMPDPLGITIGSITSTILQGTQVPMGMAIQSSSSFYNIVSGGVDEAPNTPSGHELTFIRRVISQTQLYSESIKKAAGKASNKSTKYPAQGKNTLADQLKIVAQLVAGGLKTRLYIVNIGGFDTHANQVDVLNNELGAHANLLVNLSVAIDAFQDDLKLLGIENRVVGMTFSEFGRRIISNASKGTDHGAAAPMLVFGTNVNPIIHGSNPNIPSTVTERDNLPMQFDFRSIYSSVLKDWFNVSEDALRTILFKDFSYVPVIKSTIDSVVENKIGNLELSNYPNPFSSHTKIVLDANDYVSLSVYDGMGKEIQKIIDHRFINGKTEINFDGGNLSAGNYYFILRSKNNIQQIIAQKI